jgi:hypothetical protein
MKMSLHHYVYYKTLHGSKADPVELNLKTMIPMSTTTRAMLDPEADEVDEQTDTEAFIRNHPIKAGETVRTRPYAYVFPQIP